MAGPAQGLFPETNNIDHSVPQASSGETINHSSLSLDSKEHDFNESDSINSSVLGKIIEEEGNLYGSDIREKLGSNRFFLSQLYNSKTGRKTDDKEVTDFIKYNERMEQEYKLREKLEKIIKKSNDKSDLHILNSTLLLENFVGGEDNAATNSKYDSVKNAFTWIKKPLRSKRRPHRSHIEYSGLGRVVSNSGDTQIIDLDKHGEWPIDDQMMNNGGKRTLEAWLSVSRNSEQGIARKKPLRLLSEVFSPRGNNYSIQRKLEARHIQMIASGASFGVGLFLTSGKASFLCCWSVWNFNRLYSLCHYSNGNYNIIHRTMCFDSSNFWILWIGIKICRGRIWICFRMALLVFFHYCGSQSSCCQYFFDKVLSEPAYEFQ